MAITTALIGLLAVMGTVDAAAIPDKRFLFNYGSTCTIQPASADLSYSYAGCYFDPLGSVLSGLQCYDDAKMTPDKCIARCKAGGFDTAGLTTPLLGFGASKCWCAPANFFNLNRVSDSTCTKPCSGASNLACGGALTNILVYKKDVGRYSSALAASSSTSASLAQYSASTSAAAYSKSSSAAAYSASTSAAAQASASAYSAAQSAAAYSKSSSLAGYSASVSAAGAAQSAAAYSASVSSASAAQSAAAYSASVSAAGAAQSAAAYSASVSAASAAQSAAAYSASVSAAVQSASAYSASASAATQSASAYSASISAYSASLSAYSASSAVPSPSPSVTSSGPKLPAGWTVAASCIQEVAGRALTGARLDDPNLTPAVCANFCASRGFKFAGVEWYTECYCGDSLVNGASTDLVSGQCNRACGGDATQTCGGANAIQLYYNPNVVAASPSPSPSVAPSPSASVAPPAPTAPASINGLANKGCIQEVSGRALTGDSLANDNMTLQVCGDYCTGKGFSMFGVEYGRECYCGNSFSNGGSADLISGQCNMPCAGNSAQLCGGPNAINLYSA